MYQGRWAEAGQMYADALALADDAEPGTLALERGQLYNNLGTSTRGAAVSPTPKSG